jgi:hypothetical protein
VAPQNEVLFEQRAIAVPRGPSVVPLAPSANYVSRPRRYQLHFIMAVITRHERNEKN